MLLIVGTICAVLMTDSVCLRALTSPAHVFLVLLQCWEWRQLRISFLYRLWFVFSPQVFSKINLHSEKREVFELNDEVPASGTGPGDRSQKLMLNTPIEINIRVQLILVWLCLSCDCTAPSSKFTQGTGVEANMIQQLCIYYCPVRSSVHVEAAQHVLVWCSLAHRAPLLMGLY